MEERQFLIEQFSKLSQDFHNKIDDSIGGVYEELQKCQAGKQKCYDRFAAIETDAKVKAALDGAGKASKAKWDKACRFVLQTCIAVLLIGWLKWLYTLYMSNPLPIK